MVSKGLKWYKKVFNMIMIIFLSPLLALGFILYSLVVIVSFPIEITKYKKSAFYKKYKKKYSLGITKSAHFRLMNYLAERDCDIIKVNLDYGHFYLYNDSNLFLFATFETIRYNNENLKWEIGIPTGSDFEDMDEYIIRELTYVHTNVDNRRIRILVGYEMFGVEDICNALIDDDLIVYKSTSELADKIAALAK